MRVITGSARGRKLLTLEGEDVRPTTDRVKEAVFSVIQFETEGRRFLDLFAGSGQMGIEALSRGAKEAVFVDSAKKSVEIIRKNLASTKLADARRLSIPVQSLERWLGSVKNYIPKQEEAAPSGKSENQMNQSNWQQAFDEQLQHYKDDGFERINPSILKADIQAAYPDFQEKNVGFKRFSDLLKELEKSGILKLDIDEQKNLLVRII